MAVELLSALKSRQTLNPKTVLGFYASICALLLTFASVAIVALATSNTAVWLIPWILGLTAIVVVGLLVAVFIVTLKDPSKLMLGQVSGQEYVEIRKVSLGDSVNGSREVLQAPVLTVLDPDHPADGMSEIRNEA